MASYIARRIFLAHAAWRRSGGVATRGAGAAACDAGDRVLEVKRPDSAWVPAGRAGKASLGCVGSTLAQ